MKTAVLTFIIASLVTNVLSAQKNNHIEFELDPLAYALGGGSGHLAYTWKNERIQLGYGQLTLPESMQHNENVSESFQAISLKWDYFLGRKDASREFFFGPTFDYLFLKYEDNESNSTKDEQLNVGLRTGYKFDLFKKSKSLSGMYLTPWVGASWMTNPGNIEVGGISYERNSMNIFPTVHLGWSF